MARHAPTLYRMCTAGQIMDDLIPISRLEGDVTYREYWILIIKLLTKRINIQQGIINFQVVFQLIIPCWMLDIKQIKNIPRKICRDEINL